MVNRFTAEMQASTFQGDFQMKLKRSSGVLLHPTSLPRTPGIGTIGKEAFHFVDWLAEAGQSLWQVLPLGPTGYGDSPYASFSTFAGNPLLIDLQTLVDTGILHSQDIIPPDYIKSSGPIDFGSVVWWKTPLLRMAAKNFLDKGASPDFFDFKKKHASWLDNYAVFMSIKEFYDAQARDAGLDGKLWNNYWPGELATFQNKAVSAWAESHAEGIECHKAIQYFFFAQWKALKRYANEKGISIIGDIPIFVASDSADVWANQRLFQLNHDGKPKFIAGVPPDYFSATGQLWGNPLYDWHEMKKDGYAWWTQRIKGMLDLVDFIRVDHFRGFEAYWAIPAGETTAINGKWIKGPDHDFFNAIRKNLGELPILAEDLGLITDEVKSLRDDFDLPGMKVLQFAFDANEAGKDGFTNPFLPHMYGEHSLVYTGTHDNDTMQGWIDHASEAELSIIRDYLGGRVPDEELVKELVRLSLMSVAVFAVFPLQDIYRLGSAARMNTPSTLGSNWTWRMDAALLERSQAAWLKKYAKLYARNMH
jgi:4-alpha-glucanotransferase